jgi:hypothetical protein
VSKKERTYLLNSPARALIRIRNGYKRARETHILEVTEREVTERKRVNGEHSLSGECRGREGQVRTRKGSEKVQRTHGLKSIKQETGQDRERMRAGEGQSPAEQCKWKGK